jgi:hypothetical protein
VWLKVVNLRAMAKDRHWVRNDYLLGRAVQREKYLRKARSAGANEWRFSRFRLVLFRTTSATWREKQISICAIFSELSFVRNRNYFHMPTFAHGDVLPR